MQRNATPARWTPVRRGCVGGALGWGLLWGLLWGGGLRDGLGAEPAPDPIAQALAALSDRDFARREEAMRFLWGQGERIEARLREEVLKAEPEARHRLSQVLGRFDRGEFPDTPAAVMKLIEQYRAGPGHVRRELVHRFTEHGMAGLRSLVRLGRRERDEGQRRLIFETLHRRSSLESPKLLATGKEEEAALLLHAGCLSGNDSAIRRYAAFVAARGELGQARERWVGELAQDPDPAVRRTVVFLHRAVGDLPGAIEAAAGLEDADLTRALRIEAGQWEQLARSDSEAALESVKQGARQVGVESLARAASFLRLSGRRADADVLLGELRKLGVASAWFVAEAMMLNDRYAGAVEVLLEGGRVAAAFRVLAAQGQWDRAFGLLERAGVVDEEQRLELAIEAARAWHSLGDSQRAREVIEPWAAFPATPAPSARLVGMVRVLRETGQAQASLDLAVRALNGLEKLPGGPEEGRRWASQVIEAWAPAGRGAEAEAFAQSSRGAGRPWSAALGDAERAIDPSTPTEALRALAAPIEAPGVGQALRARWLAAAAGTWRARGDAGMSVSYLQRAVDLAPGRAVGLRLATWLTLDRRWDEAMEVTDRLLRDDESDAEAALLAGVAAQRSGKDARGERLRLAMLLPLADSEARSAQADLLDLLGLPERAQTSRSLALSTGPLDPSHPPGPIPRGGDAAQALQAGRYDELELHTERFRIACLGFNIALQRVEHHLLLSARVLEARARRAMDRGDWDGAEAGLSELIAIRPASVEVVIDFVTRADAAGRGEQAGRVFNLAFIPADASCRRFPGAGVLHNRAAWLAARCGRALPRALELAERGVALLPREAAVWDTLAEARWRSGAREAALAAAKRAAELDPRDPSYRDRLRGWAQQAPPSP